MDTNNEYWERLQPIIARTGLTISAFARQLGYARPEVLYQIKKGNNRISMELADRITARYPEVRRCWLLCGEGTPCRRTKRSETKGRKNKQQISPLHANQSDESADIF